ncbi:ABC transporter substrate-binding protein [Motiliproteus sp. MSK22-1]|uniref:substrate-binding periplasmic protein n=1 Tax=Motiliproteus sp. MSK22-1 TaxID=1897630 RepID=UPI000978B1C7|nr:transporter substrate-binding domain-containing protein [Motiliproteus sp. MSK22-1]OMH29152.1 hypothetical protein BGP75_20625 [Motiliproteus sp. MSK22-1]
MRGLLFFQWIIALTFLLVTQVSQGDEVVSSAEPAIRLPKLLVFSAIEKSQNSLISAQVLVEAYRRIGVSIQVRFYPAKRALLLSNNGLVDGELFRIRGIEEQYQNLRPVPVPVNYLEGVVYAKQLNFQVTGWDSIKPYRIGIRRGVKFTEKGTVGMNTKIANSNEELFTLLEAGHLDVIALARLNGIKTVRDMGLDGREPLPGYLVKHPLIHYLHKRHEALVPKIQQELEAMEREGVIRKIREQQVAAMLSPNSN